jgi:hypothetical protein
VCPTPPVTGRSGWSRGRRSTRPFRGGGASLFYSERQGDKEPLGVIILDGCTELAEEETEVYAFKVGRKH